MKLELPKHKCGLYLEHNAHLDVYETVEERESSGYYEHSDWVNDEQKEKAIKENNIWILQWYPNTPITFYALKACDLEEIFKHIKENNLL